VKTHIRLAAAAAAIALPALAIPVWTAGAATAATAAPAQPAAPAATCTGTSQAPNPNGSVEGLIGNVSPAPGSTVSPGATISFLVADEKPFPLPLSGDATVTANGAAVTPTVGAQESGVPITYANPSDKGSQSTSCEIPVTFTVPSGLSGTAQICATGYDGDNNHETVCWTYTVQTTVVPVGAIGGLGVAAIGGAALMLIQRRRRRTTPPPSTS
jgi:hypothetical protein